MSDLRISVNADASNPREVIAAVRNLLKLLEAMGIDAAINYNEAAYLDACVRCDERRGSQEGQR